MVVKKRDFVELEYTGKLKEGNVIFDTTDEKIAKSNNFNVSNARYGPVVVCVGEGHVIKGLDSFLEGKELGEFVVEIEPENAFGKKDAKLIAMMPASKFISQKIRPVPGLQVNIDGVAGVIRTVNSGRCIIDFNHPLSGKVIVYNVKINRIVSDKKEKAESLAKFLFGKNVKVVVEGNSVKVETAEEIPAHIAGEFKKKFDELTGVVLEFVKKTVSEKPATLKQ